LCLAGERANGAASQRTVRQRGGEIERPYGGGTPLPYRYTQEDFNRWARADAPKRMTSAQLDPDTGLLAWPRVLLAAEYSDQRRVLDRLFEIRAKTAGAIGNDIHAHILDNVDQMTARLVSTVTYVRGARQTKEYLGARRFLESLAYETEFESADVEAANVGAADNVVRR
jgi:hypothetical protein